MSIQIQIRRDTAANWTAANPILASGEEGLETDTGRYKVGDGVTAYNSLVPYGQVAAALRLTFTGSPKSVMLFGPSLAPAVVPPGVAVAGAASYLSPPGLAIAAWMYAEDGAAGGLTSFSFDNLTAISGNFSPSYLGSVTSFSAPLLTCIGGSFDPNGFSLCTTFSFPSLAYVGSFISFNYFNALTSLTFPALVAVGAVTLNNMAAATSISFPALTLVGGHFGATGLPLVTSFSLPVLKTVSGNFNPNYNMPVVAWSLPELTTVGGTFNPSQMPAMTSVSAPKLTSVGDFSMYSNANLTTISLPALTSCGGTFSTNAHPALTTVSVPAMVTYGSQSWQGITLNSSTGNITSVTLGTIGTLKRITNGTINCSGQKIPSANVNSILALLVSLDGTNGTTLWGTGKTLTINGGTNGAPTGQGITDKATLVGRGATITTN